MIPAPFQIVLVEPEIPPNTGNIARLTAATGSVLNLVEPLGFSIDDRYLKRAGLDYWHAVDLRCWKSLDELRGSNQQARFVYTSTRVRKAHIDFRFLPGDFIVFGKETKGLPEHLLEENPECCVTIPMPGKIRSLNLSTAAGIILYEALRQTGALSCS